MVGIEKWIETHPKAAWWNILGCDADSGGMRHFFAYLVAMVIGFFINKIIFPEGEAKKKIEAIEIMTGPR